MPALSFQREWLDRLLLCEKQQTTRPQTDRFQVGDTAHVYIEQRRRIIDKPLRRMTHAGVDAMYERGYPFIPEYHKAIYHAHFLGKVVLTEVYEILPSAMSGEEREAWAWADGFQDFDYADAWFMRNYDGRWVDRAWTAIRWIGWQEQYFVADEVLSCK